jgi:hypothetical protein
MTTGSSCVVSTGERHVSFLINLPEVDCEKDKRADPSSRNTQRSANASVTSQSYAASPMAKA